MTSVWEILAGSIVLGWMFHLIPVTRSRDRHAVLSYCFGIVFCAGSILLDMSFGGLWVAVLAPFGVMLPALCLRWSARKLGYAIRPVPRMDKLVVVALMLVVVLGTMAAIPVHPYSWFYDGIGAGALAMALGLWALWRRQTIVLGAVVLGQILWLLDVGSSNFYDHMAHFGLIPALLLSALSRARSTSPTR